MKRTLTAIAAALVASTASANVTYTYTSEALTANPAPGVDPVAEAAPLVITLTLSDDGSVIRGWSATQPAMGLIDPHTTAHGEDDGLQPLFYMTTDSAGSVSTWYLSLFSPGADPHTYSQYAFSYSGQLAGQPLPSGVPSSWDEVVVVTPDPRVITYVGANIGTVGTWSSTGTIADLDLAEQGFPSSIPEPTNAALLLAGLAGVALARRRALSTS